MSGVTVVIPFESDDPVRIRNLEFVKEYYASEFPLWNLYVCPFPDDDGRSEFPASNIAQARNLGAAMSDDELLIFNDADSLVLPEELAEAAGLALDTYGPVFAFQYYYRLSQRATEGMRSYRDAFEADIDWAMKDSLSAGCIAIQHECFNEVEGFDPSWQSGFEDYDFACRCRQRWPLRQVNGELRHLWHPRPAIEPEASMIDSLRFSQTWRR